MPAAKKVAKTIKTRKTTKKKTTAVKKPKVKKEKVKKLTAAEKAKGDEVLKSQPVVNIGLVGHVDHGKTTLTERLSGKWTDTHSEEIKRGITIRLGYADSVFRKCEKCSQFTAKEKCECGGNAVPLRKVSFVDAPGHESLMATMLAGATLMDGALLLISAAEFCPQPQTREHLMALEIIGVKNVVVVQNKVDLVDKETAVKNFQQIKQFLKGSLYENAPIIPVSAKHNVNVNLLVQAIEENIPTPESDSNKDPIMLVARSFDINKPGTEIAKLNGGVLGGGVKQGIFKKGDEIEIKPGYEVEERNQKVYKPLKTKIVSIISGGLKMDEIRSGGTMAILTTLDPAVIKSDKLTGALVGHIGKLPPVKYELGFEPHLLERVVGTKEDIIVEPLRKMEPLMLNINSATTVGFITDLSKNEVKCKLKLPVCCETGARITISRRVGNRFRLIGYGILIN